ncbi:hypothetical protein PENTCL1PPCAC_5015 [Pristionchus entomophagus]|uniref:G protein-coupled receptor n=1 Tax=Pristionchus entomophagus TaxID=358040 RepID=A0AAV5SK16_9BILA|nr:hypothetical protein PENTCL1PPCAC_5015 [Pristionchus entomophagus]
MEEPFDPNHPRYYHIGCCDTHVTKAARAIAIASLVFLICRTILFVTYMGHVWTIYSSLIVLVDLICILLLLAAVYDDIGLLVFPYLAFQTFIVCKNIVQLIRQFTYPENYFSDVSFQIDREPTRGYIIFEFVARIVELATIIYFFKIIVNFYLFLKRRDATSEKDYGSDGVQYQADPHQPYNLPSLYQDRVHEHGCPAQYHTPAQYQAQPYQYQDASGPRLAHYEPGHSFVTIETDEDVCPQHGCPVSNQSKKQEGGYGGMMVPLFTSFGFAG